MDIGIGLPATVPGADPRVILDWARRADAGPFSSLAVLDRVVYPNFEPLITLSAAAGVTERIRLMTTVLLAPLRTAGVLAKQAASLDALSGGRLTLGLGVGGREDDFRAAPASYHDRARRFEEQLATMKQIWSGQSLGEDLGAVGPLPARAGGPELLLGGYVPAAIQRVGRWADGFITGGVADPTQARQLYELAEASWRAEGRAGRPRFVGTLYYALGPQAEEQVRSYILDYYGYFGSAAEGMAATFPASPEAVREKIQAFSDAGADELVFWPSVAELEQLERLADLVA